MDLMVLPNDEHQSSLHEASPVAGDANNGHPSTENGVIVMRHKASPRLQSAIEFCAPCDEGSNGFEYQNLHPTKEEMTRLIGL
jgi:hypothetical protein